MANQIIWGIDMVKKKKLLITLGLAIMIIGLFFLVYVNGRKDVPKLTVTYNGNNIEVGQGSYRWKSRGKLKEFTVDNYAGVISKLLPAESVAPNSSLELKFDYQPQTIKIDGGYKEDTAPTIKNNIINIPGKSGGGIYFLECEWQEGTVTYLVVVQIQ
jgi:hypothetical protein